MPPPTRERWSSCHEGLLVFEPICFSGPSTGLVSGGLPTIDVNTPGIEIREIKFGVPTP